MLPYNHRIDYMRVTHSPEPNKYKKNQKHFKLKDIFNTFNTQELMWRNILYQSQTQRRLL